MNDPGCSHHCRIGPSGARGSQADLKTFQDFGVYGEAVVTLITVVQNTRRLTRVEHLAADLVAEQIAAVMEDIPPHAAKVGAPGTGVGRDRSRGSSGQEF